MRKRILLTAAVFVLATTAAGAQCNQDPVAVDDTIAFTWRPFVVAVTTNDHDPDGDALQVSFQSTTCNAGTAVSVDLDLLRVVPADGQKTSCSVQYLLSDGRGGTDTGIVEVTATGVIFDDGFESGSTSSWNGDTTSNSPVEEDPDLAAGEV